MSVDIVLKNGQSGYDAVGEYVEKYWEQNGYATAIVALETSYEGKEYLRDNEVVSPTENCESLEFLYDWWEGQKYIKILGIRNLHAIELITTTDVEEVRHGEWKDRYGNKFANRHYECSVCQEPALDRAKMNSLMTAYHEQYLSPFCPHCGAKMDGERKEQNEG